MHPGHSAVQHRDYKQVEKFAALMQSIQDVSFRFVHCYSPKLNSFSETQN